MRPIIIRQTAADRADHDDRVDHDDRADHDDCADHDDRADHNRLDLHRTAQTLRGRTPRSRSDRSAIAARSSCDRASFVVESPQRSSYGGRCSINTTIVARSWRDRGSFGSEIKAKLTIKLERN